MIGFIILCTVLTLLVLLLLWPSANGRTRLFFESSRARNTALAKERLAELNSAYEQDELNKAEFGQAKADIEASLAADLLEDIAPMQAQKSDKKTWFALALLIPVIASFSYLGSGHSGVPSQPDWLDKNGEAPSFAEILLRLETKVADNPDDPIGHRLLANLYMRAGRFIKAEKEYEKVVELEGEDAELLSSIADAHLMSNDQTFDDKARSLLDKALILNPQFVSALWLSGLADEQAGNKDAAREKWLRADSQLDDQPELQVELKRMLARLDKNKSHADEPTATTINTTVDANYPGLSIRVSVHEMAQSKIKATDTVFVFAKALSKFPMPIAAKKISAAELPLDITLSDADSLQSHNLLSAHNEVLISVKVVAAAVADKAIAQSAFKTVRTDSSDTTELMLELP